MGVIAILASDVHASLTAPSFRSVERDWLQAQGRVWDEVRGLSESNDDAPIIVAGDLFDRWDSRPELVNFMIWRFPKCYTIPGQHDAPNHRLDEIHRSSYQTLVEAGVFLDLGDAPVRISDHLVVHPFAWGREIVPLSGFGGRDVNLAVVHSYIWLDESTSYVGAESEKNVSGYRRKLGGYNAAVFGDNHKGFSVKLGGCHVMNCGTLIIRKSDEADYRPRVGLLRDDGSVETHFLDTSNDRCVEVDVAAKKKAVDSSALMAELTHLGSDSIDFRAAINQHLEMSKTKAQVTKMVLESIP